MRQTLANIIQASIVSAKDVPTSLLGWCLRFPSPNKKKGKIQASLFYNTLKQVGILPAHYTSTQQKEWATSLAERLQQTCKLHNAHAGEQAVNIEMDIDFAAERILSSIAAQGVNYGFTSDLHRYDVVQGEVCLREPQTTIVEYSSPNIAKPFHAGHMRSTILGQFLSNVLSSLGDKCIRINYLGDWGTQFGYLGVGFKVFGEAAKLRDDPMTHLFDIYVKANQSQHDTMHAQAMTYFKAMEDGDPEALKFWKLCRDLSLTEYQKTYQQLGINFDVYEGESMYQNDCLTVIKRLKEANLLQNDDKKNVKYIDLTDIINNTRRQQATASKDHENERSDLSADSVRHVHAPVLKSDGSSLYLTRDIAAAIARFNKYNPDRILYVVENGQHQHFMNLSGILYQLKHPIAPKVIVGGEDSFRAGICHVKFGRVNGMSTRRGEVVFLKDILDEAFHKMKATMLSKQTTRVSSNIDDVAHCLGVSGLIVQDLKERRRHSYDFSWDRMLQAKGDTGVMLQYTHARLCSLEEKAPVKLGEALDWTLLNEPVVVPVLQCLLRFDEILSKSYYELEGCHVVNYLFQLCHLTSRVLDQLYVQGQPQDVAKVRLQLFHCCRITIANGLKILGMKPLTKM